MLKENLLKKLNDQVTAEHYASNLYLAMSSWCQAQGLNGAARFLSTHSKEELEHMYKLFNYINETGSMAIVGAIEAPPSDFEDLKDVFEQTYQHELLVTSRINELVELTLNEKDYSTFNFLQWYVAEQHEEEALFKGILDRMEIVGIKGRSLFMLDQEIGRLVPVQQ
ncbi:non-heme ferritin [Puteibacter caeruleilacunae]|nr:non-heme ferritin [Puteibacter caeruleilacunae]